MPGKYKRSGGVLIPVITTDMTQEEIGQIMSEYAGMSDQERRRRLFALYLEDYSSGTLSDYTEEELREYEQTRREYEKIFVRTPAEAESESAEKRTENLKKIQKKAAFPHEAMREIREVLHDQGAELTEEDLEQLDQQAQEIIDSTILSLEQHDSGYNTVNTSPLAKALLKGGNGKNEIFLGENPETGERAVFTLLSGYMDPYEIEITEDIAKFKLDGQVTERGKIWFTLGQLYRAMRHGAGTTRLAKKEQRDNLYKRLESMAQLDRRLEFRLNEYLRTYGGFEANGGKLRIIGFDEFYGRIRGQEDTLIVLDNTPIINQVAENLRMREIIPQEVKAIKQLRCVVEFKKPITVHNETLKSRSFATKTEAEKFCIKNGISADQIQNIRESMMPWNLTETRISIRAVLTNFVYGHIRARAVGAPFSNKLPYDEIAKTCRINQTSREIRKRMRNDIAVIMDHLQRCIRELDRWQTYTRAGSESQSGIEIFIDLPKIQ